MLGDIVHNEAVVKEIRKAGVKKIKKLRKGDGKILLIRAHGTSEEVYEKATKLGYTIIDATCPMVKEIHKMTKISKEEGCEVIIIGDKKHDEVRGIIGQLEGKAVVIDSIKRISLSKVKRIKKACVVVQSTQNMDKTLAIVDILKKNINDLKFYNTICRPTRVKQKEIKEMPLKNDLMIIIGSRTSANTKRLYQISRSLNKKSYWIQSRGEIKKEWFCNTQSVGIMAGASTPDYTTNDVIKYIKSI
jgi:4-hydroxy-3-methylbut-2-enyl diphosphate reductase